MFFKKHPYKPSVLVTRPRGVLTVGIAVSLTLHTAMGVWVWDQPIGEVPVVTQQTRPIRVKRAARDYFNVSLTQIDTHEAQRGPTAEDLSEQLLEAQPLPLVRDPMELDIELRPIEEPFEGMTGGLEIELPAFELDDDVLASLDTRPPAELDFGDRPGDGNGQGDSGNGRNSADLADAALGQTGTTERRTGGGRVLVERRELDQPTGVIDTLPGVEPDLDAVSIDFVDLALGDTTQIEVPESLDNDFAYQVTRYVPRDRRGNPTEDGYLRVDITAQRSLHKLQTMPKDVIFIVDTSSSVPQDWVTQITQGVSQSLVALNAGDRFNIVLFNERVSLLSDDGVIDANEANFAQARDFLDNAQSVGYTDVNSAMRRLLVRDVDQQRVYELVLITDGQSTRGVVNTRELINLITRDNDLVASIYCVGVANRQNRELLNFLAYRNKGFSVYAEDKDQAASVIQDLMSRLRYPIIKDVRLDVAGLDSSTVFPIDLPNIHQGETFRVYGRFEQAEDFTMRITGASLGQEVEFTFTRDLDAAPAGDDQIAKDWGFWKLHHLYSRIIQEGELPELLREVEALRSRYGLRTLY